MVFRGIIAPTVMLAVLTATGGSGWARPQLDDQRLRRLSDYDVLLFSDPAGPGLVRHKAIGVFDAAPEEIFRIASNFSSYREYIPHIASRVLAQEGGETLVHLKAALPWPLRDLWVDARYQYDMPDDNAYRMRFGMVKGNLRRYEGSLLIEPFGDGRTTVTYELLADPQLSLPRSWVQRSVGHGVSNFVHCLRGRVNHLMQQREPSRLRPAPAPRSRKEQPDRHEKPPLPIPLPLPVEESQHKEVASSERAPEFQED